MFESIDQDNGSSTFKNQWLYSRVLCGYMYIYTYICIYFTFLYMYHFLLLDTSCIWCLWIIYGKISHWTKHLFVEANIPRPSNNKPLPRHFGGRRQRDQAMQSSWKKGGETHLSLEASASQQEIQHGLEIHADGSMFLWYPAKLWWNWWINFPNWKLKWRICSLEASVCVVKINQKTTGMMRMKCIADIIKKNNCDLFCF